MKNDTVITIGRQFGSGGSEIGKIISGDLGIPFYDHELIAMVAEKRGYNHEILENVDEKNANPFLQSFAGASFAPGNRLSLTTEISLNDKLFFAQADIIRNLACKGSCVIVGRCADYVLRNHKNHVSVFIHASIEQRERRVARLYAMPPDKARSTILKIDKKRASYYNYHSNKEWGSVDSYDLAINSGCLGIKASAAIIADFAQRRDESTAGGIV